MEQFPTIYSVDPNTFEYQSYITEDSTILLSSLLDTQFNFDTDYIEYFIYDDNQNKISLPNFILDNYSVQNGDVILYPENNLVDNGFNQGSYYIKYNFFKPLLKSSYENNYYITEISSERTEIRLSSNSINSSDIITSTNNFIQYRDNSPYFIDFYLNLGNNNLLIANNIKLDETSNNPDILVKLYEPLPDNINLKQFLWIVEKISEPQAYLINFPIQEIQIIDYENIKGPNFDISLNSQSGISSDSTSYSQIIYSPNSSSIDYITNFINDNININYENFSNFVHFSSVEHRLNNFYNKISLINLYDSEINDFINNLTSNISSSTAYELSKKSLENKKNSIISNFDGYEKFLYFNSGSLYSWPKQNNQPPYQLYSTSSIQFINWWEEIISYASSYDQNNQNWLYWIIPEYLRNDSENRNYEIFLNMIGHHFDNIWIYIDNISNKFNADNRLNYGISKNLIADTIKDFGIKLYNNNFSTNDLYTSLLGITPEGSQFPFPYITNSLPVPNGYEYINTKISSSNDIIPLDDINKRIYKRIYHNLPHLLKTKGTIQGLKSLLNIYGIPDTIINPNNTLINGYSLKNISNKSLYLQSGSRFESSLLTNANFITKPQSIEFRLKLPNNLTSDFSQSIFTTYSGSQELSALVLEYTGSNLIENSYSGSSNNPYNKYATLKFIPSITSASFSASIYLPLLNDNWWSIQIGIDETTGYLQVAQKGEGNIIYNGSDTIQNINISEWSSSQNIIFPAKSDYTLNGNIYSIKEYEVQEIRYYKNILSESIFNNYVLNPYYIKGNLNAEDELIFRAPLGSYNDIDNIYSIHPKFSGSWVTTSSFNNENSSFNIISSSFIPNKETIYINYPNLGLQYPLNNILINEPIIPDGNSLSNIVYIQQFSNIDNNIIQDLSFSPQNEINNDIINQLGNFNIGEYIGDPRKINEKYYEDLQILRENYFKKYLKNYNINDFIRLIKYFDNSLFKILKDFIPAENKSNTGITIKSHILERNKHILSQGSFEKNDYSSSLYDGEKIYSIEGGTGGSTNIIQNNQIWNQNIHFPYEKINNNIDSISHSDNSEFYNGEYPNSYIYTELTKHCQKYKKPYDDFLYDLGTYGNSLYDGDKYIFDIFKYDFDCQPNFNNVDIIRPNNNLQDIDYSFGISSPINLQLILSGSATRGTVPESNYTMRRHRIPRYDGSKVSSDGFNSTGSLNGSYDKYAPVESKKYYMGYINEIQDPYPVINNKTNLRLKYIIDKDTNIDNPSLSDPTYYNMINTFNELEDIKISLNIPKNESQFIKLNNNQKIYKTGNILVPILYSQTASNGWSTEIPLSSSNENSSLSLSNYGEIVSENNISNIITPNTGNFYINPVKITSSFIFDDPDSMNNIANPVLPSGIISASLLNSDYTLSWKIRIPSIVPQTIIIGSPDILLSYVDISESNDVLAGYYIENYGNGTPIGNGVCWSLNSSPTISSSGKLYNNDIAEMGNIELNLGNYFTIDKKYYFRAFAITEEAGVVYSNPMFITYIHEPL